MLTVQFATRNGAGRLPIMLGALARLEAPAGGWKLVVTDSASTDATLDVLAAHADALPMTVVRAERPGKNHALNVGLPHVEGDLVVFTDDDVIPNPDWLVRLRAAADAHPEAGGFGGAALPDWPRPPEQWILDWVPLGPVYALTDPAWPAGPCAPTRVWGANMAIRAALLDGMRFDEGVGPDGTETYRMGSETTFTTALAERGATFRYVPDAIVLHMIRPEQLERDWILGRAFRSGRMNGASLPVEAFPRWFGTPRFLWRKLAEAYARHLAARLGGDPERIFRTEYDWRFVRGVAYEAREAHRAATRRAR